MCKLKQQENVCNKSKLKRNKLKLAKRIKCNFYCSFSCCCCNLLISIALILLVQQQTIGTAVVEGAHLGGAVAALNETAAAAVAAATTTTIATTKGLKEHKNSNNNNNDYDYEEDNDNDDDVEYAYDYKFNEALTAAAAQQQQQDQQQQQQQQQRSTAVANVKLHAADNNNNDDDDTLGQQQQVKQQQGLPTETVATTKATATTTTQKTSAANVASKYEIRAVAGEPNYKSVNLTWEVEFVPQTESDAATAAAAASLAATATATKSNEAINGTDRVTNDVAVPTPPNAFQIFYCELQTFGPQRCRVKLVNGTTTTTTTDEANTPSAQVQHFAALIDNLRMATRYSFHVRPQPMRRAGMRIDSARADSSNYNNEIESELKSGKFKGQTIVIPTKSFSAHATQCLPHASEIEVETGPYFGGRIVVDGGNCGIKGNPLDAMDKYTMRIDHKICGSMVKPETNTVETFITVQENPGIFTHSTRRFVVVCSYQSGMQTVRASFTVPGKPGLASVEHNEDDENDPFIPDDDERTGRDMRQMRFVDKSHLVLKSSINHNTDEDDQLDAVISEVVNPELKKNSSDITWSPSSSASTKQNKSTTTTMTKTKTTASIGTEEKPAAVVASSAPDTLAKHTKYAKLVRNPQEHNNNNWYEAHAAKIKTNSRSIDADADDDAFNSALHYITTNLGTVLLTVAISVIIIAIFIVLVQRLVQRQRRLHQKTLTPAFISPAACCMQSASTSAHSAHSSKKSTSSYLPHKTLPRALQQQHQYQCNM